MRGHLGVIACAALLALGTPVLAEPQSSRCETARDLMNSTRRRLQPAATPAALQEATQNLRRATELCPGLGDAYYFLSLIAAALKDQARADNWRTRADFYGSTALKNSEPLLLDASDIPPSSTPATADRPLATAPPPPPVTVSAIVQRKLALVVGVSRFRDSHINALKYTSKDAEAIAKTLKTECEFDEVKVLLDEDATTYNVKTAIDQIARMADANDLVVIYISSHGSPENLDVAGVNYIVTHDTEVNNLYPTAYRMDDLLEAIGFRLKAERVVAFLDTCYSGATYRQVPGTWNTTSRSLASQGGVMVSRLQAQLTAGSRALVVDAEASAATTSKRMRQGVGRVIITSSSQAERSWEGDEIQHGYFTYYLLEALNTPGTVSVDDIFGTLRLKVPQAVLREKGQPQNPGIARSRDRVTVYLKDKILPGKEK